MCNIASIETKLCEICGKNFKTSNLLVSLHIKKEMEKETCTGFGICKDCSTIIKENEAIAFIGIDPTKSTVESNGIILPENAYRTGKIFFINRAVASGIVGTILDKDLSSIFVSQEDLDKIITADEE